MHYVYVMQSQKDKQFYTGFTSDLQNRFREHNAGRVSSTKERGPFELIYYEACLNEKDALVREKYLKSGMGKRYLKNSLILKVMLEDIPRHGPELGEELRRVGKEVKEAAEKKLLEFYPINPDGAKPIAYLWARTLRCEAPNCGAEIPLIRSFWLAKKAERKRALRYKVLPLKGKPTKVEFEIFEPKGDKDVSPGTMNRAKATCLCCNAVLSPQRVRAQLREQRGGADVIFDSHGQRVGGPLHKFQKTTESN